MNYGGTGQGTYGGTGGAFSNITITGGTGLFSNGAKTAVAIGFAADGAGWYRRSSDTYGFSTGAIENLTHVNTGSFEGWAATGSFALGAAGSDLSSTAPDVFLTRDAANIIALKNGNTAQESRVYAGNGGFISQVKSVTESLTIAAAATTVGATSIPAGAILLGVAARVTTVIPTAATFTMTTTVGGTTLNTAAVSTAANSTDPGTAAGASYRAAATTVTITPNLTPGTATGVVRLQYYYLQVTPPTS